ncbi:hypothetical protein ACQP10_29980 [Streptosporangium sandarakinum]|uniref:hypothetical protein n=1 Tax=Streptosporangium sandarakinum TaxID=1260955 RepID=UPI003D902D0B
MRAAVVVLVAAGLLCAACGEQREVASHPVGHVPAQDPIPARDPLPAEIRLSGGGVLTAAAPKATAIVYDAALAPPGASVQVTAESGSVFAVTTATVSGFLPGRTYGAHLHVDPCGKKPAAAGPHFRRPGDAGHSHSGAGHGPGAKTGHSDPGAKAGHSDPGAGHGHDGAGASAATEFWLDFTTDATGAATATSRQDWAFTPAHRPRSLVVHAEPTTTSGPDAGAAGARVACVTLVPS